MGNGGLGVLRCDCGSSPLLCRCSVDCIAGVVEDGFGISLGLRQIARKYCFRVSVVS